MKVMSEVTGAPTVGECHAALGSWWYHYDHAAMDEVATHMAPDMRFRCRTASGTTAYEDFVRADLRGRDEVLRWQVDHRNHSPYPLRHHATSTFVTAVDGEGAHFVSYIFVTTTVDGRPSNVSSGVVRGTLVRAADRVLFAELDVTLDTVDSRDALGTSAPPSLSVGE